MTGKNNLRKIISIFLSFVMIMACAPTPVIALDSDSLHLNEAINDPIVIDPILSDDVIESVTPEELMNRAPDEKTLIELKEMTVDVSSLPSFIDSGKALQKGHVNRLKSRESNLNTVVFQNNDGTETTYIFMRPVKYIDDNGVVQDKSDKVTSLTDRTYSYGMMNNNVKALFPKSSNYGAKIQYQNYSVQMKPDTTYSSVPSVIDDTTIVYNGVFGENTLLKYQTKLNGVKEDIVLIKNVGQNEFGFTLTLTNLSPTLINDIWYLKNSSNDIVASLGEVIISDSAGNDTKGTMSIESASSKGTFNVKISVPQDFLNSASTVYPVYIDPTVTISEQGTYYGYDDNGFSYVEYYDAIQDTGVYSTSDAVSFAQSNPSYHILFEQSLLYGKVIYKLYDFYGEYGQYKSLEAGQINSAVMYINIGSGDIGATLRAAPMTSTWDVATYGENPIAINDNNLLSSYSNNNSSLLTIDTTSGQRAINITNIVKGWADYNNGETTESYNNPSNGFILGSASGSIVRNITAVEETSVSSIYVEMDTSSTGGNYYVNNTLTGRFLSKSGTSSISAEEFSNNNDIVWKFQYIGNNQYYIRSMSDSNKVLCYLDNAVKLSTLIENDTKYIWQVTSASGGGVILKNKSNNKVLKYDKSLDDDNNSTTLPFALIDPITSSDPNYKQTVWALMRINNYVNLQSVKVTNGGWIGVGSEQNSQLSIQPSNASWKSNSNFYWESCDPSVATISETGRITGVSNGYAKIIVTHKPTGTSYTFYMTVGVAMNDGTYYAMNKSTGRYLSVEGSSVAENAFVEVWSFLSDSQERWQITYSGSGYYRIKSVLSGKYLTVSGGSTSAGANVVQVSQMSTANHIKITKTPTGAFKLAAMTGESNNCCIGIQSSATQNGINCSQLIYTDDADYRDEWALYGCEYSFNVDHYYDEGFSTRFNYINSNSASLISSYHNSISERLLRIFNVNVTSTYHSYTSSGDDCKIQVYGDITVATCNTYCTHIPTHLSSTKLRDDLSDGTNISTVAIWTGHLLDDNKRSNSRYDRKSIIIPAWITSTLTSSVDIARENSFDLIHELSHQLGANDHYCYGRTNNQNCSNFSCDTCYLGMTSTRRCIMSRRYDLSNIGDEDMYCSDCESNIKYHLSNHH